MLVSAGTLAAAISTTGFVVLGAVLHGWQDQEEGPPGRRCDLCSPGEHAKRKKKGILESPRERAAKAWSSAGVRTAPVKIWRLPPRLLINSFFNTSSCESSVLKAAAATLAAPHQLPRPSPGFPRPPCESPRQWAPSASASWQPWSAWGFWACLPCPPYQMANSERESRTRCRRQPPRPAPAAELERPPPRPQQWAREGPPPHGKECWQWWGCRQVAHAALLRPCPALFGSYQGSSSARSSARYLRSKRCLSCPGWDPVPHAA